MRIAIVGAGGVGGHLAARLAAAGADVHVVARGRHLEAIRAHGLTLRSVGGDVEVEVAATDDAAEIGPCDAVLVCVKSQDTDAVAAAHLPALVGEHTTVVSLQNGIDNEERLARVVGWPRLLGGLALIFAGIAEPGVVAHTGGPGRVVFGELDGTRSDRVERLRAELERAHVDVEVPDDVRQAIWNKYAFICAQAGVTAATRLPIGEVRDTSETWALFRALMEEAYAVARAEGVSVEDDAVDATMEIVAGLPGEMTSSLHDDLVAGRRLELDALHGALVRRGERHGVDVPATRTIHAVLAPWARRAAAGA